MEIPRERRRSHAVNLTPLIDVVFLLIVFFMLSTSFVVSESMELAIPQSGEAAQAAEDVWVLRVKANDEVQAGEDAPYSLREFNRVLKRKMRSDPDQKILILSGEGTNVQQLVNVLDRVYLAGARQVQIDAEKVGSDDK